MIRALASRLNALDAALVRGMRSHGVSLLRVSLGIIFLWFGGLKFFPHLSPAEGLAARTIETVSVGLLEAPQSVMLLAAVECLIGLGLVTGRLLRLTLGLLWLQMLGTITPLFLFPGEVFTRVPYAPTLEGQYIIKNLVIISASIVIGSTLHGGEAVREPPEDDRDS